MPFTDDPDKKDVVKANKTKQSKPKRGKKKDKNAIIAQSSEESLSKDINLVNLQILTD